MKVSIFKFNLNNQYVFVEAYSYYDAFNKLTKDNPNVKCKGITIKKSDLEQIWSNKKPLPTDVFKLTYKKEDLYPSHYIEQMEAQRRLVYEISLFTRDDKSFTSSYKGDVAKAMAWSNQLYYNTGYIVPQSNKEALKQKLFDFNSQKELLESLMKRATKCGLVDVHTDKDNDVTYGDILNFYYSKINA